jgi:glycogen operon protein
LIASIQRRESTRIALHDHTDGVWHGFVPGVKAGQPYGIRAHGAYAPEKGDRFNFANLLLDPYARAIDGDWKWGPETFGYRLGNAEDADLQRSELDSAANTPRSVVIDSSFDWAGDRPPRTPLDRSIVYEVHVKGFTKQCPKVPENLRGTYAGLASEFAIDYLKTLGVTAVELLPIHHFVNDDFCNRRASRTTGATTRWDILRRTPPTAQNGDPGGQVREFKEMVKALHAAGLEVILDVVYNHTAEGNHLGPTLCFRGLDNAPITTSSRIRHAITRTTPGAGTL